VNYKKLKEMVDSENPLVWDTILEVIKYEESKMNQARPNYKKDLRKILEDKTNDYQRNNV